MISVLGGVEWSVLQGMESMVLVLRSGGKKGAFDWLNRQPQQFFIIRFGLVWFGLAMFK